MEHSLIERLVSRIEFTVPAVEKKDVKVKNTTKREESYHQFFDSITYHEVMVDGNPQLRVQKHTYTRPVPKKNSRRDDIRMIGKAVYKELGF